MNGEEIYVDVVAHEHANMDSLPFRYGFQYAKTSELRIYDVENKEFQSNNRIKLQAKFLDDRGEVQDGTFILIKTFAPNLKLVTVWRNDQQNEFYLSELMKRLRKAGTLSVQDLLDLHPRYVAGELATMDELFKALLEKRSELGKYDIRTATSEIQAQYDSEIASLKKELGRVRGIAKTAIDGLNERDDVIRSQAQKIQNQDEELKLLQQELEPYRQENKRAAQRREIATLGAIVTLQQVNRSVLHRGSSCTELVFSDGTRKYMKTATFDRDLSITTKAERLVGSVVRTTCWDPVHEPGKWSRQGYFRGIYEVDQSLV